MKFEYKNVVIEVPNRNKNYSQRFLKLVDNVSGEVESGEILAIMGPSGSGKTTLLSALAGRIQSGSKTTGVIKYGGLMREKREWMRKVGYVDQDDHIFENLTVQQTLEYAAKFRLKGVSAKNIDKMVDDLVTQFGLKHVTRNQMHKLSGGERKRTMIAVELMTDPDIIFLDEPTSGLDTRTAFTIIKSLKDLTKKGKTVIFTIHQPSIEIYSLFDKLLLMTEAKTVYSGLAKDFEGYLEGKGITKRENISFPDFIAEMVVRENIYDEVNPLNKQIKEMIDYNQEKEKREHLGRMVKHNEGYYDFSINFKHIFLITSRHFKTEIRNTWKFFKPILLKTMACFAMMYLFGQSLDGLQKDTKVSIPNATEELLAYLTKFQGFFYFTLILGIMHMMLISYSMPAFFDGAPVIKREIAVGSYSTTSYFIGIAIYCILNELTTPILMSIAMTVFMKSIVSPYLIGVLFGMPFFFVPVGVALGSLTANKKLTMILSSILLVPMSIPALAIVFINIVAYLKLDYSAAKAFFIAMNLFVISPFAHYTSVVGRNYLNALLDFFHKNEEKIKDLGSSKLDIVVKSFYLGISEYIGDINIEIVYSYIIFILLLVLLICFGIYRQSCILMPRIRTKLEK